MPKHNKSVLQRQYRNKEIDGFSLVRTEIFHATGGEVDPKTRQDVLRKAARLIRELYMLNTKLQHQLCNSRPGSETPPSCSYVRGLESAIRPSMQDPCSSILCECFIESNGVCQVADIIPHTGLQAFATSMDYELRDTHVSSGNIESKDTASVYDYVISQMNIGQWSPDHQFYNYSTSEQVYQ